MASRFRWALIAFLEWLIEAILHWIFSILGAVIALAILLGATLGVYCALYPFFSPLAAGLGALLTWWSVCGLLSHICKSLVSSWEKDEPP